MNRAERQNAVLRLRARGLTRAQACRELGITSRTVRNWGDEFRERERAAIAEAQAADFTRPDGLVSVRQFVLGREFLNYVNADGSPVLYPAVADALDELCSGKYHSAVITGSIGVGKTSLANIALSYVLFELLELENPQEYFGLDARSEIVIVFQSLTKNLADAVGFARFRELVTQAPYFRDKWDRSIESELRFPNRITVRPVHGGETGAIGSNVHSYLLDEVNHAQQVQRSLRSVDGVKYDQAWSNERSLSRRRKSRFMRNGRLPGLALWVGSARYPGQFTDTKTEEAKRDAGIFVFSKRPWDVRPELFCGDTFRVFVGDDRRAPRVLLPGEKVDVADRDLVMAIPVEYRADFDQDIVDALREIAGVATQVESPFYRDRAALLAAFKPAPRIFSHDSVVFGRDQLTFESQFANPRRPRAIHIDLSQSRDATGIASGYISHWMTNEHGKPVPYIVIDFCLQVCPLRGTEIPFARIQDLVAALREHVIIGRVTFDQFQSVALRQSLAGLGLVTGVQSVDRDSSAHDLLKSAVYESRIDIPEHPVLLNELSRLQYESSTGKVDHPANGSKDVADAVAGVVIGLHLERSYAALPDYKPNAPSRTRQSRVTVVESMPHDLGFSSAESWRFSGSAEEWMLS